MEKKGISLMLSYVLLIIIVIAVAIGVYAWLRFWIWEIEPIEECPGRVSLIVQDYECFPTEQIIQIRVENKGLFNISGYAIKGTENKSQEAWFKLEEAGSAYIGEKVEGMYLFKSPLLPGENDIHNFSYTNIPTGIIERVEIEAFRIQERNEKKEIIYCDESIASQEVFGC